MRVAIRRVKREAHPMRETIRRNQAQSEDEVIDEPERRCLVPRRCSSDAIRRNQRRRSLTNLSDAAWSLVAAYRPWIRAPCCTPPCPAPSWAPLCAADPPPRPRRRTTWSPHTKAARRHGQRSARSSAPGTAPSWGAEGAPAAARRTAPWRSTRRPDSRYFASGPRRVQRRPPPS